MQIHILSRVQRYTYATLVDLYLISSPMDDIFLCLK